MALAYLLIGILTGSAAASLWLVSGGTLSGACVAYALAGQIGALSLLTFTLRRVAGD